MIDLIYWKCFPY